MSPPRILIADDSPAVCRALARTLAHLGSVDVADGGENPDAVYFDAVHWISFDPPAVLVVDGLEGRGRPVARFALEEGIPVVAYTGSPALFDGLDVPVVVKPEAGQLVAAVAAALGVEPHEHKNTHTDGASNV